jgi:hypothetical protein
MRWRLAPEAAPFIGVSLFEIVLAVVQRRSENGLPNFIPNLFPFRVARANQPLAGSQPDVSVVDAQACRVSNLLAATGCAAIHFGGVLRLFLLETAGLDPRITCHKDKKYHDSGYFHVKISGSVQIYDCVPVCIPTGEINGEQANTLN